MARQMRKIRWTVFEYFLHNFTITCIEVFLEPSACAAFQGPVCMNSRSELEPYLEEDGRREKMKHAVHIAWATGGGLVPEKIREEYIRTAKQLKP